MKLHEKVTIVLFCGFLFLMGILYWILPQTDFSVAEKRYLQKAPVAGWKNISSGQWGEDAESWMADHIPGRDFFVGLNAYFELVTGRQDTKDIRLRQGRLLEAPAVVNEAAVERNLKAIHGFSETIGRPVNLMIVPSAGWAAGEQGYQDDIIISDIYAGADGVEAVDVRDVFRGRPELYYATDHHWTSAGAHAGYRAYMAYLNREYRSADDFTVETVSGFQGSTYSRSALWLTPGEPLELWQGSEDITVTNAESKEVHSGVFYRERLDEADKYTVFLDGNHSLVRIQNPNAHGKLLVIRDSYSNALGCFLAESYGEVVLVDLRYYREQVSKLVLEEEFDHVLVCYSIGNFLTDTNIVWLR